MRSVGTQSGVIGAPRKADDKCFAKFTWAFDDVLPSGAQREEMHVHILRLRATLFDLKKHKRGGYAQRVEKGEKYLAIMIDKQRMAAVEAGRWTKKKVRADQHAAESSVNIAAHDENAKKQWKLMQELGKVQHEQSAIFRAQSTVGSSAIAAANDDGPDTPYEPSTAGSSGDLASPPVPTQLNAPPGVGGLDRRKAEAQGGGGG